MNETPTPLEALQRIKNRLYPLEIEEIKIIENRLKYCDSLEQDFISMRDFKYKQLDAIEIIKKKECLFKGLSELTQEEYELLKEVLL